MTGRRINICLHDIVFDESLTRSIYDVTFSQLEGLINVLKRTKRSGLIDSYELFFDDGYASCRQVAEKIDFGIPHDQIHAAVISEQIGESGKMTWDDLSWLSKQGFSIDSHGVSHAALAVFSGNKLQRTPEGGEYVNAQYGKKSILPETEVLYQLKESAFAINKNLDRPPESFVLPYGLYNYSTVMLIAGFTAYKRVYTCDIGYDTGQYLAPRLLITQENITNIEHVIINMPDKIVPLAGGLVY